MLSYSIYSQQNTSETFIDHVRDTLNRKNPYKSIPNVPLSSPSTFEVNTKLDLKRNKNDKVEKSNLTWEQLGNIRDSSTPKGFDRTSSSVSRLELVDNKDKSVYKRGINCEGDNKKDNIGIILYVLIILSVAILLFLFFLKNSKSETDSDNTEEILNEESLVSIESKTTEKNTNEIVIELEKIKGLKDSGVLSEAEFNTLKKRILDS